MMRLLLLLTTCLWTGQASIISDVFGQQTQFWGIDDQKYRKTAGNLLGSSSDLSTGFGDSSCWRNAAPPFDALDWRVTDAQVSGDTAQQVFGIGDSPSGEYAVVATESWENPEAEARLLACPIRCTHESIEIQLKYWASETVQLFVCLQGGYFNEHKYNALTSCRRLRRRRLGKSVSVRMPPGQAVQMVIVAKGFNGPTGGIAILDDIKVSYTKCPEEPIRHASRPATTTTSTTTTTTSTTSTTTTVATTTDKPALPECTCNPTLCCAGKPIDAAVNECPLEDPATLFPQSDSKAFDYVNGRVGPRPTGVPGADSGELYLGTELNAELSKAFYILDNIYDEAFGDEFVVVFTFRRFLGGTDTQIQACCDTPNVCPLNKVFETAEDRDWVQEAFHCPPKTKTIIILCEFTGVGKVGCGIDSFKLFVAPTETPEAKQPLVCGDQTSCATCDA